MEESVEGRSICEAETASACLKELLWQEKSWDGLAIARKVGVDLCRVVKSEAGLSDMRAQGLGARHFPELPTRLVVEVVKHLLVEYLVRQCVYVPFREEDHI